MTMDLEYLWWMLFLIIRFLLRCPSLWVSVVVCGPYLWDTCALLWLYGNEQKLHPVLIELRLQGSCTWLWIRHTMVHWGGVILVGTCWDLLILWWGNDTLLLWYWIQDLTGRRRFWRWVQTIHFCDILWWPLNLWWHNLESDSTLSLCLVCCWPVILWCCSMTLVWWVWPHIHRRGTFP